MKTDPAKEPIHDAWICIEGADLHDDGDAAIGDVGGSEGDWSAVGDVVRRRFGFVGAEGFGKRH